ncbi:hypothetical protein [Companilactobacillus muriivasis]|uniref:hypothetical protein n=1 Tax=Companilactobacillus muriivasis TaxID=3081444 RepID=UPI0030C6B44E
MRYKYEDDKEVGFWEKNKWFLIPLFWALLIIAIDALAKTNFFTKPVSSKNGHILHFRLKEYDFTFLAAILAIIGYSIRQKQKLVAEQVAKSRIEWLKITREYFSKFMSYCEQTAYYKRKLRKTKKRIKKNKNQSNMKSIICLGSTIKSSDKTTESLEKKIKSIEKKMDKKSQKANEYYYKMKCSINPKDHISEEIKNYFDMINQPKICKVELDRGTEELSKNVQKYFKDEWDKAKTEIRTGVISPKDNKNRCQN